MGVLGELWKVREEEKKNGGEIRLWGKEVEFVDLKGNEKK